MLLAYIEWFLDQVGHDYDASGGEVDSNASHAAAGAGTGPEWFGVSGSLHERAIRTRLAQAAPRRTTRTVVCGMLCAWLLFAR